MFSGLFTQCSSYRRRLAATNALDPSSLYLHLDLLIEMFNLFSIERMAIVKKYQRIVFSTNYDQLIHYIVIYITLGRVKCDNISNAVIGTSSPRHRYVITHAQYDQFGPKHWRQRRRWRQTLQLYFDNKRKRTSWQLI